MSWGRSVSSSATSSGRSPGWLEPPVWAAVWGGGGFLDILFWFGLYMALAFLSLRVFLVLLTRVSDGILRTGPSPP